LSIPCCLRLGNDLPLFDYRRKVRCHNLCRSACGKKLKSKLPLRIQHYDVPREVDIKRMPPAWVISPTIEEGFRGITESQDRKSRISSQPSVYFDRCCHHRAVGANGSASLRKTGCQGILLRGEVLFIEVDANALNPLKTTSIHNAARMVESCATNPIRGGPARKPT